MGSVAYRPHLPSHTKIHPVFHVSLLKKHTGPCPSTMGAVPDVDELGGLLAAEPVAVLARRLGKKGN